MRLDPTDPRLNWEGCVGIEADEAGEWWRPRRLLARHAEAITNPSFRTHVVTGSGVRLRVRTDATAIDFDVRGSANSTALDLCVDGHVVLRVPIVEGVQAVTAALPSGMHDVDVWLPQLGVTDVGPVTLFGAGSVHPVHSEKWWIAYGSSLTQSRAALGPSETWPSLVARSQNWGLRNLGFAGSCHLEQAVARTIRDVPADLISLCVGINIYQMATFNERSLGAAIVGFVQTIRDGHRRVPIVIITPVSCSKWENVTNEVGLTLSQVRLLVERAALDLRDAGDKNIHVIDGLTLFGVDDEEFMVDGLHLSAEGYRLLAERAEPVLARLASGERVEGGGLAEPASGGDQNFI